ncbi:MAG: YtxH domain-containing protein [Terriglobales bacterium]
MSEHGDYQPADHNLTGVAVAFFLVGAAVGAGIALLVAPQSGKQTRRMLQRRYEDAADAIAEKADAVRERGREIVDEAKEKVAEAREKIAPFAKRSS